jgi:hypothetical protein
MGDFYEMVMSMRWLGQCTNMQGGRTKEGALSSRTGDQPSRYYIRLLDGGCLNLGMW